MTGATGRIGSHLVDVLLEQDVVVRALCLPGDVRAARLRSAGVEIVEGSLTEADEVAEALHDAEDVFHLGAALTYRRVSRSDIFYSIGGGTFNLLEGIRKVGATRVRLLSVSSSSVYYSGPSSPFPRVFCDESTPIAPSTLYGASKRSAELLVEMGVRHGWCSAVVARPSNTADPDEIVDPHSVFGRQWFVQGAIDWYESGPPDAIDRVSSGVYEQLKRNRDAVLFYRRADGGDPSIQIASARSVAELLARSIGRARADSPKVMNVVSSSSWSAGDFVHRVAAVLDIPSSRVVPVEEADMDHPWLFGTAEDGWATDVLDAS